MLDALLADLRRDEGLELKPYYDTADPPRLTIGYGRNLDDVGITRGEADYMLSNDVEAVIDDLDARFPWWQDQPEDVRRAMANMCFNLGLRRFAGFQKMLAAIEAGDRETAATEALDSRWATQVGDRAQRIADLLRGDAEEIT